MKRIIISDEYGQHGLDIRTAINYGYGSDISDEIEIISGWSAAYARALNDENIIALIRSTSGVASYVNNASSIYPRVQTFFPLGSNTFTELTVFNINEPPVIITSGAGDFLDSANDRNNTGYGKGLEFWDRDLTLNDNGDESSFSNGFILGKLLVIKDILNCTWWEARFRARVTAYRNEPNRETSMWDLRNGYGRINTEAAIEYLGLIPADPYLTVLDNNVYFNNASFSHTARCSIGEQGAPVTKTVNQNSVASVNSINEANILAHLLAQHNANAELICRLIFPPIPATNLTVTHKNDWSENVN